MRILPINSNLAGTHRYNQQNFKGLWGDEIRFEAGPDGGKDSMIEYTYYPFEDEPDEEALITANSIYDKKPTEEERKNYMSLPSIFTTIMMTLPFTAQEYKDYLSHSISEARGKIIEKYILEKNLHTMKF